MEAMEIYTVGGAVRDELLGLPVKDRDYVVVGATPEVMLAQGFRPVGKDFPVFLHPRTHEEYALARTERKTAPGYKGFAFHAAADVTLEQDLARRDLTVNAIARATDGSLIDPYGGLRDLQDKLFRHVSPSFAEDPVRILRVARFAARFPAFKVFPATNVLMQEMVAAGEVDALVPERVWQELARGLMEQQPSRMFEVLRACGALARILPELDALWHSTQDASHADAINAGQHTMQIVDRTAQQACDLSIRFAALMRGLGRHGPQLVSGTKQVEAVCARIKVPNDSRDLALMLMREQEQVAQALNLPATGIVALLMRCDAFRKSQRFLDMLRAAACLNDAPFPPAGYLEQALQVARQVDSGAVAAALQDRPQQIAQAVQAARINAVDAWLLNSANGGAA